MGVTRSNTNPYFDLTAKLGDFGMKKLSSAILVISVVICLNNCSSLQQDKYTSSRQGSSVKDNYQQGLTYFQEFKNSEAKSSFDRVLTEDSIHKDALYYRGRTLIRLDRVEEALGDFDSALSLDSRYAPGHAGRAEVFIKRKNLKKASWEIAKALELVPREAQAWYLKGVVFGYQNKINQAMDAFMKCLDFDPKHAYGHYELGLTYNQKGKKDMAIVHLEKFLELAPNAPEAEQVRRLLSSLGLSPLVLILASPRFSIIKQLSVSIDALVTKVKYS